MGAFLRRPEGPTHYSHCTTHCFGHSSWELESRSSPVPYECITIYSIPKPTSPLDPLWMPRPFFLLGDEGRSKGRSRTKPHKRGAKVGLLLNV